MNSQPTNPTTNNHNKRVRAYRSRLQNQGVKRVEVRIPISDVPLMHNIAGILRTGGDEAYALREQIHHAAGSNGRTTGKDLITFFRSSPLKDASLDLERDTAISRTITF